MTKRGTPALRPPDTAVADEVTIEAIDVKLERVTDHASDGATGPNLEVSTVLIQGDEASGFVDAVVDAGGDANILAITMTPPSIDPGEVEMITEHEVPQVLQPAA